MCYLKMSGNIFLSLSLPINFRRDSDHDYEKNTYVLKIFLKIVYDVLRAVLNAGGRTSDFKGPYARVKGTGIVVLPYTRVFFFPFATSLIK